MRLRAPLVSALALLLARPLAAQRVAEVAPMETTVSGSNGVSIQNGGVQSAVLTVPTVEAPLSQPSVVGAGAVAITPVALANPVVSAEAPLAVVVGQASVSALKPGPLSVGKATPASPAVKATKAFTGAGIGPSDGGGKAASPIDAAEADARTAQAVALIRETERDWTEQAREDGTATPADFAKSDLENRRQTLRRATQKASFGLVEGLVVKTGFAAQSRLNDWRSRSLRGQQLTVRDLVERYFDRLDPRRKALMTELKEYVPGLDPDLVVKGELLGSFEAIGYSIDLREKDGIKNLVWLRKFAHDSDLLATAAHEGFHQGDRGYVAGLSHLKQLQGEKGRALGVALLEGYTEFRTREALRRLTADAQAGKKGLPETYAYALRSQYGGDLANAAARREENDAFHPYHPFVRLVEAVMEKPGGREALDAFVSKGTVSELVRVLGYDTLDKLGDVAAAAGSEDWSEFESSIASWSGLQSWVAGHLEKVVRGEKVPDTREMTRTRDAVLARAVSSVDRHAFLPAPAWRLRGIRRLDLRAALEAGESLPQLLARVDAAARVPFHKYFIPPVAQSIVEVLGGGQFAAAAALTPGLMAFAYLRLLLGAGLGANLVAVYAGALGLWLGAEIVSGVMISWFPTRNLLQRWARPGR